MFSGRQHGGVRFAFEQSAEIGLKLLAVFSLGLGLPFLVFSLLWGQALRFVARVRPLMTRVNKILGMLLVLMAALILSGYFNPLMIEFLRITQGNA